jgi:exo-beta-1,3-glucanase (GH17 family)
VDCAVLDAYDDLEYKGEELEIILGLHPYPAMDNEEQEEANLSHYIKSINLQLAEISMWNRWDRIAMLVVGSQGVHHERYSRSELVRMIRYVRLHLESEQGFRGLITTVEPVQSWASPTKYNAASIAEYKEFQQRTAPWQKPIEGIDDHNSEDDDFDISNIEDNDLCAVVDLVSLTIQPYFNSGLYPR